jgi:hypothetical protein
MAINGQAIKQDFLILSKQIEPETPITDKSGNDNGCCFILPALAELTITSDLKNDKHSVIWFFNQLFTTALMTLQKYENGVFSDIDELDSNTYGFFYDFGFFENKYGEKAIGYLIDWQKVLATQGEGDYRVKIEATPTFGADFEDYSFDFCLKQYLNHRADYTTRISWKRNGQYGDEKNDEKKIDFGMLDWYNQLRLPNSFFGRPTEEQEKTYTKYESGAEIWTGDKRIEKYAFTGILYPSFLHRFIQRNITSGDNILITDYNIRNPNTFVDKKVVYESSYEPKWNNDVDRATIELTFKQEFQNLVRKRD